MDKKRAINRLTEYLTEELSKESVSERKSELEAQLLMYRFLPKREYSEEDVIVPSALVRLQTGVIQAHYLVVPQGGGLITEIDGEPLQVITPNSPLGEKLLGKKVGDSFLVEIKQGFREYRVLSIT